MNLPALTAFIARPEERANRQEGST